MDIASEGGSDDDDDDDGDDEDAEGGGQMSKKNMKKMIVSAVQMALRLQRNPTRRGRHRDINTEKRRDALEMEKAADRSWQRNFYLVSKLLVMCWILTKLWFQQRVCDVSKEKFNVSNDEEYSLHDPPSQQEVRAFELGKGTGPDPTDPRIDMKGKIHLACNAKVTEILLAELQKKDWKGMPGRSEAYMVDLIESKLERARSSWRTAQPKLKDGEPETIAEVERRIVEGKEERGKINRAYTRRKSVGSVIFL